MSKCRYPTLRASKTARYDLSHPSPAVPKPICGIATPLFNVTTGVFAQLEGISSDGRGVGMPPYFIGRLQNWQEEGHRMRMTAAFAEHSPSLAQYSQPSSKSLHVLPSARITSASHTNDHTWVAVSTQTVTMKSLTLYLAEQYLTDGSNRGLNSKLSAETRPSNITRADTHRKVSRASCTV